MQSKRFHIQHSHFENVERYHVLKGKNAIITGTNRGIGKALVEVFAENGANIWACARNKSDDFETFCRNQSEKNSVIIEPLYFDLIDDTGMKEAIKKIHTEKRNVDILVNNAGISPEKNTIFQMTKFEDIEHVMNVNFISTMKLTQLVLKFMLRQKRGSIINFSSVVALYGDPAQLAYAASKGAIASASMKLASEYGEMGIRVNAIAPGPTKTDMLNYINPNFMDRLIGETMLGRVAEPREIANVAAFLASDLSSYITGQIIKVNGGLRV